VTQLACTIRCKQFNSGATPPLGPCAECKVKAPGSLQVNDDQTTAAVRCHRQQCWQKEIPQFERLQVTVEQCYKLCNTRSHCNSLKPLSLPLACPWPSLQAAGCRSCDRMMLRCSTVTICAVGNRRAARPPRTVQCASNKHMCTVRSNNICTIRHVQLSGRLLK
jgi:hypothetical protein